MSDIPDGFRQAVSSANNANDSITAPPDIDLSSLDTMSREELIALLGRFARLYGGILCQTSAERKQLATDKLMQVLQCKATLPGVIVQTAREVLDREEGKSIQRIDQRIQNVNAPAADMTNDELLAELRKLPSLPAGMKLLENGQLEVTDADFTEIPSDHNI